MPTNRLMLAHALALLLPVMLIAGALGSQYLGGLVPCQMCHWQRWPHYAAIVIALVAFAVPARGMRAILVALAGMAILTSGLIGVYHAGTEYHWWPLLTACASSFQGGSLADMMAMKIVACDVPQWTLFGFSLAGYNALLSIPGAIAILVLLSRKPCA